MRNFILITALSLLSLSGISVSVSQLQTVEAQPGEEVTLTNRNLTNNKAVTFWFRLVSEAEVSCVSIMIHSLDNVKYCEGFEGGKFNMSTNFTNIFLKIKNVDKSDSGLYFCGFYTNGHVTLSVVRLNVKGGFSVSVSQLQTVEAQPGEEVTLTIRNLTNNKAVTFWFRLVSEAEVSCVSVMILSLDNIRYCEGFRDGRSEMNANITSVSLKIKYVKKSDSGLYFCGFYRNGDVTLSVVRLNVKDSDMTDSGVDSECDHETDGVAKLTSVILGALTVILVMIIIGLIAKVRKLQSAADGDQKPQLYENLHSGDLKDGVQTFYSTLRGRGRASEREVETRVFYTTRK